MSGRVSVLATAVLVGAICMTTARAESPFAATVVEYVPACGQFVRNSALNDPARALGPPIGGGVEEAGTSSLVTLGGFGGTITLGFDHTITDDPTNPFGLDCIVHGNAFWVGVPLDPNRRWAECGVIEVSRDTNGNGLADDAWYLIPGSHITDPAGQTQTQTWDTNFADATYPPANPAWVPYGYSGMWTTQGIRLPSAVFDTQVIENPNGPNAQTEGVFGYADLTPTLILGDLDADDVVDDPSVTPEQFYTRPDHPLEVGITPGSGGGDGFDIAWAIDPATGESANLTGIDFVRITTGVNYIAGLLAEVSTEVDAAADVPPAALGDADGSGFVDLEDYRLLAQCLGGPSATAPSCPCRPLDFDGDGDVDLADTAVFLGVFSGAE